MSENWQRDREFKSHTLEKVHPRNGSYTLVVDGGLCLSIPDPGFEPRPGDRARFYGRGFGFTVRGVVIGDRVVYYRTRAQQDAHERAQQAKAHQQKVDDFERDRDEREARYLALPHVFRARIDRFRAGSADFQIEHEPYEMFCCEQAVMVADALSLVGNPKVSEILNVWKELSFEQQRLQVPGLSDGHSGNTFGASMRLAYWYATQPENVNENRAPDEGFFATRGGSGDGK